MDRDEHRRSLRRLALQVSVQLPEEITDARYVLETAREIVDHYWPGGEREPAVLRKV